MISRYICKVECCIICLGLY